MSTAIAGGTPVDAPETDSIGRKRVLFIGDGMRLTTGFATVIRHVAKAFVDAGHEVHQIAGLDVPPTCRSEYYVERGVYPWFPLGMGSNGDAIGTSIGREVCTVVNPEIIVLVCDAGTAYSWMLNFQRWYDWDSPTRPLICLYSPIEGTPITASFGAAFKLADVPMTVTQWGSTKLKEQYGVDAPYIYHGVDTRDFRPLPSYERKLVRESLGWSDKFVVTFVARNNGRKGHDRIIKAASIIKEQNSHSNVLFYLHCKPFEQYTLEGWDLQELRALYGVEDFVQFAEIKRSETGVDVTTLAQRIAASDVYISPSSVEGFGLPILEAMACGLPVVVTQDRGNQEEVAGDGAIAWLPVIDWQTWHTNAEIARVAPESIAMLMQKFSDPRAKPILEEHGATKALVRARSRAFDWPMNSSRIYNIVSAAYARRQ